MGKKIKNLVGVSLFGIALASTIGVSAASTADYYQSIDGGVSGTTLADALNTLVTSTHTHKLSYDNLWSLYGTSDVYPGTNKIWDTYSEVLFNKGSDQAGSYQKEGDAYNREHTVPQSWFNENLPMKGDAFHVLATDGYVNNRRGSYLYGEVKNATYTSKNGSKLGSSMLSGYSGTVFEPIDEYKGDIARGYFYMAIRYKDQCGSWTSGAKDVFKSSYPYLSDYALDLFTKWSHLDPVSDKEIIRNDAIEAEQGNRNPFIDHPEWVDTIWNNSYVDTPTKTAYSALDVIDAVDALQTSSTDADVYNAYAKYCRLNTSDKLLVTNSEALFTKVKSKSGTSMDLSNYWSEIIERNTNTTVVDQDKVDAVIASIDKLPLTITMEDTQNVRSVQQAYAGLNYTERTLVTNYSKLSKAIDTINALESEERVNNVIAMIAALPDTITLDDKDAVYNADNAFMALSFDERCNVTNAEKLTLALQMISALESTIYKQIKSLEELEVGDKVLIVCPKSSYALGGLVSKYYRAGVGVTIKDDEIALPENSEATILTVEEGLTSGTYAFNTGDGYLVPSKEDKYKNLVTEATITEYSSYTVTINDGVANLVSPKAKNGIMAYDTSHYDFTSYETVTGDYTLALFKYTTAGMTVNEEKVNKVIDMINNLPNPLSYTDSELISEIFTAYAALNTLERAEVTNYDVLRNADLEVIELTKMHYAEPTIEAIDALPTKLTLNDSKCTVKARELYNQLDEDTKSYVTNYDRLVEIEAMVKEYFAPVNSFEALATKASMKFNYTVTESDTQTVDGYYLVTEVSSLQAGDVVVIASAKLNYALSTTQESNYRGKTDIQKDKNSIIITDDVQKLTLEKGTKDGTFAFNTGSGYLSAVSSSKNYMQTVTKLDDNASFSISINEVGYATVKAQGDWSRNLLCYNEKDPRFSCYGSTQSPVALYKLIESNSKEYSVSDVYLRFGGAMDKSTYESLLAMGNEVKFGMELSKNEFSYTSYYFNPVFVASIGAKDEDKNGAYVQYAALIPVKDTQYYSIVYARAFVEIDGVKFYMQSTGYSAYYLADYYIKNSTSLNLSNEIVNALGVFTK